MSAAYGVDDKTAPQDGLEEKFRLVRLYSAWIDLSHSRLYACSVDEACASSCIVQKWHNRV